MSGKGQPQIGGVDAGGRREGGEGGAGLAGQVYGSSDDDMAIGALPRRLASTAGRRWRCVTCAARTPGSRLAHSLIVCWQQGYRCYVKGRA